MWILKGRVNNPELELRLGKDVFLKGYVFQICVQ